MCTGIRFTDKSGENMYFGRNLDWSSGYGQSVITTPRDWTWHSAFEGPLATKRAIIGMAIVVENMPLYFDCANEDGLAIAGLNFPGYAAFAPDAVPGKTNVAAYEFPLWVAARFSTVDEVEAALADTAIVAKQVTPEYPVAQLHWIIGDKTRSIVVEYTAAGMQVFHDGFDVLTNQPGFDYHRENVRNYMIDTPTYPQTVTWRSQQLTPWGSGTSAHGIPGDYSAPSRFVRSAYLNAHYPDQEGEADNVARLFRTLWGTSMILGAAQMDNGICERTVYTGGYSAATKTYYFTTYENPDIRSVSITEEAAGGQNLVVSDVK